MLHRFPAALGVALVLSAAQAHAGDVERVVAMLDGLCVGTGGDNAAIEKMALAAGGAPAPKALRDQDPAIAMSGGVMFRIPGPVPMLVAATASGGCSLLMQGIDVQRLKTVLTQTYPLAKPYIESAGPQISTAWRILPSSIYAGGVIAVTEGKPGFGADGFASIGYQSPEAQERQRQADAAAAARKKP